VQALPLSAAAAARPSLREGAAKPTTAAADAEAEPKAAAKSEARAAAAEPATPRERRKHEKVGAFIRFGRVLLLSHQLVRCYKGPLTA